MPTSPESSDAPRVDAPGGTPVDAAALRRRIEHSRARIQAAQTRARLARTALDDATSSATSSDHAVTVTVSPAGTLVDLSFGPSAQKTPLPTLARTVLTTYRAATTEAVQHTESVMREMLGPGAAPVLDMVRASLSDPADEKR